MSSAGRTPGSSVAPNAAESILNCGCESMVASPRSDHLARVQRFVLLRAHAQQASVDLLVVLPELWTGRAHASWGPRQLRRDVLHLQLAEIRMRRGHDRLARLEVRILEHLRRA